MVSINVEPQPELIDTIAASPSDNSMNRPVVIRLAANEACLERRLVRRLVRGESFHLGRSQSKIVIAYLWRRRGHDANALVLSNPLQLSFDWPWMSSQAEAGGDRPSRATDDSPTAPTKRLSRLADLFSFVDRWNSWASTCQVWSSTTRPHKKIYVLM
jgi:hypothetical protein